MSEVLQEDEEAVTERFACDCGDSAHNLDVFIMKDDEDGRHFFLTLEEGCRHRTLWERAKTVFKVIWGKPLIEREIIIRDEDVANLIKRLQSYNPEERT